ncbi:MAG TPA: hypothetical protein VHB18_06625 [Mycobacteriales bacterium]|nr:hypothetical protein [Mycobacteriales bacterium]
MTAESFAPGSAVEELMQKLRTLTYFGVGACIVASVLGAVLLGTGWSWPLFVWGVAIGPAWVAGTSAVYRYAGRYVLGTSPPPSRFHVLYPAWAAMGVPFGVFSACFETAAPDVGLSGYAVIATLVPLVRLPRLRRRFQAATTRQECPFKGACGEACSHPLEGC